MNAPDDWGAWGEAWRGQSVPSMDDLRRRVRRKRWRMGLFVGLEMLLSLYVIGLLLWLLLHPGFPALMKFWVALMLPLVLVTQAMFLHVRRGTWRAMGEDLPALLALLRRRALAGIRLAKLWAWSNGLQALTAALCFAPELTLQRWRHDPWLRRVVEWNVGVNVVLLGALFAGCAWYIRRQRRKLAEVEAMLRACED